MFLSLPNGKAQKIINKTFYKFKHLKYIDLSSDFRITNPKIYKDNYKNKPFSTKINKTLIIFNK